MIHNPLHLILILLSVESVLLFLSGNSRTKHLFKFLPSMFWIYFLPMVLSTCGVIDAKSPLYQGITKLLLPPALFLLLLNMDIKAISRLGPVALVMFFSGTFGIMLGMVISFIVFKPLVGAQFWSGFGALAASWTGGSANMIAVKEALNTPDAVFMHIDSSFLCRLGDPGNCLVFTDRLEYLIALCLEHSSCINAVYCLVVNARWPHSGDRGQ